ncbi:UNVERIFIED_CONTAM: hypothetical protein IGO34_23300 [Salmonella enterica subsp. enterica serovar Weltevreden]
MYDTETGEEFDPEDRFDEMLDELYESITVAGIEFEPSRILKECDPIAYRVYLYDEESERIEAGEWSETDPEED